MKDRNSIIGLVLIAVIMFVWMYSARPSKEELVAQKAFQDSINRVDSLTALRASRMKDTPQLGESPAVTDSIRPDTILADSMLSRRDSITAAQQAVQYGIFSSAASGERDTIVIENEKLRILISAKGGRMLSAELKNFHTYDTMPLLLFDGDSSHFDLSFFDDKTRRTYSTKDLFFKPMSAGFKVSGSDSASLVMRLFGESAGQYIDFIYGLNGDDYHLNFRIDVHGMDDFLERIERQMLLTWNIKALSKEKFAKNERNTTSVYWKYGGESPDYINEHKSGEEKLVGTTEWVAFKQQYFTSAIISHDGFSRQNATVHSQNLNHSEKYTKSLGTELTIAYNDRPYDITFFLGPNRYDLLKDQGIELELVMNLGWPVIRHMSIWLIMPIFHLMESWGWNYGLIILLLTIIIKLILFPITYKNYKSSAKMRVLKPQVDQIKEKLKDDAMKAQQATMSFYKQMGVNPMAGCVPMLLQMPILYAMFRFFPSSIELRQQSFLWAEDLSTYDSILNLNFNIPFYGDHVSLFTLLMAVSMFLYSKYNMQMSASSGMQANQMKIMMYFMPVMLLAFFNTYSAGLSYYYFLANIISVAQQLIIKKYFIDEGALLRKLESNKKKVVKKSKFQQRLEAAAKARGYQQPPARGRKRRK